MITSLRISNYALIRELELTPNPSFNIITGETGSGKSIIMGALSLLQGRRSDAKTFGVQLEKSAVEAEFSLTPELAAAVNAIISDAGASENELCTDKCVLRREITPSGRSRAAVNGVQVQLAVLGSVASLLLDIHSQHKNLLLGEASFQLEVLDTLAKNAALLAEYKAIYADYRVALQNFARTRDEIERTRADADYLEYQLNELDSLDLTEGEEEELEQQRTTLANASELSEVLTTAANALQWDEANASDLLSQALSAINDAAAISDDYAGFAERLQSVVDEVDDIADAVSQQAMGMRDNPRDLDEIERRLSRIYTLKNKHRVDSVEALIEIRDSLSERLAALNDAEHLLKELEKTARGLKRAAMEKATALSARRKTAASQLINELTSRARPLGMANLSVDVRVISGKLNPDGIDTVEFLFAFNKNQAPAPIGNRASGGEISRVMLALKSVTAEHQHLPTIIFDEIDTGVSGDVANRMGELMAHISRHMQVLTITHLPQVAAKGLRHFKVFKRDDDTSTRTFITQLTHDERRSELALMLSGNSADTTALAAADNLLKH